MEFLEDVPLAPLTTLAVGGPARRYFAARDEAELIEALALARERALATLILGGGSNLLVADAGFDGLALRIEDDGVEIEGEGDGVRVRAGAGLEWDALVALMAARGLAGIACLSGVPGRVGAAPIQNIGAYGQEIAERVIEVRAVARDTGAVVHFGAQECGFGYRWSHFKGAWRDRFVITAVTLRLEQGGPEVLRYAELQRHLGGAPCASPSEVREAVLAIRRGKSMVYDTSDPNHRSAGSFFVNPVVGAGEVEGVLARIRGALGEVEVPSWPAEAGGLKLSAAWLIERSGFGKGFVMGGAGLSTRHCLAVINRGQASAAEIVALAEAIQAGVAARFGVALEPEPVMVGF